ncbi:hypothetical protein FRC04_008269 [Tulasnella sp. 424]|nr:hypothetical protein FRC04_008269 [Tulasnella sp. 424]KAG8966914.1 hypothetical protein FRC05_002362 [Tulasnella sp. 425]
MRSFVALSVVLATSSAVFASPSNVSLNPRDLVARQATTTPTACEAQCTPVTNQIQSCATDLSCMCGAPVASAFYNCVQCGYGAAPADVQPQLQGAWTSYVDSCKTAGYTVSESPTLTGSSSSSSSSTGTTSNTNSGTNTNSNTGTNTNSNTGSSTGLQKSNDASRSAALGFIGLGALALAVSSLF